MSVPFSACASGELGLVSSAAADLPSAVVKLDRVDADVDQHQLAPLLIKGLRIGSSFKVIAAGGETIEVEEDDSQKELLPSDLSSPGIT